MTGTFLKENKYLIFFLFIGLFLYTFRILSPAQNSHILKSTTDFDTNVAYTALDNYQKDGLFKHLTFPNRKGLYRGDYYVNSGGCVYSNISPTSLEIASVHNFNQKLYSYEHDCIYTHYPQLIFIYQYVLNRLGFIENYKFKDFVFSMMPIYGLFLIFIFLNLNHIIRNEKITCLTLLLFLFSKSHLDYQFDVHTVPLELMFFNISLYSFLKKNDKVLLISSIFAIFSGFDFLLPSILLVSYRTYRMNSPFKKKIGYSATFFTSLAFLFSLRFFVLNESEIKYDFTTLIKQRILGGGYFSNIFEGIPRWFQEFEVLFLPSWLVLLMLVLQVCLSIKRYPNRRTIIAFGLFISFSLFLIVPSTTNFHAFAKSRFMNFFVLPILALCLVDLLYLAKKNKILALTIGIFCFYPSGYYINNIIAEYKSFHLNDKYVKNNQYGINNIIELTIGKRDITPNTKIDQRHWDFIAYRKNLIAPAPPYKIIDTFLKSSILNNNFEIFLQTRENIENVKLTLVISNIKDHSIECSIETIKDGRFTETYYPKKNIKNLKNIDKANYLQIEYDINDNIGKLFKLYCQDVKKIELKRIWITKDES